MRGIKLIFAFVLLAAYCSAQKDTSAVLQYVVKVNSANYKIFPEDNYLFVGVSNRIKITVTGKSKISEIKLTNGKIKKTAVDSIYIVDELIIGTCLLSIYEKLANGKSKVVMNKLYQIIDYPKLNFNGVTCDSTIAKIVLCGGILKARYDKFGANAKVIGFKMDILEKGKFSTDSSADNRLTKKMRLYVAGLKEGSIVYIKDVKYLKADGKVETEPIFRLFLGVEEKSYMFRL